MWRLLACAARFKIESKRGNGVAFTAYVMEPALGFLFGAAYTSVSAGRSLFQN